MPNLWKWLMQANEKNAFALSMCVLLASAGASAWLFTSAAKDETPAASDPATRTRPPASHIQTSIGLTEYVDRQLNSEFIIPVNPFAPSLSVDNIERILAGRGNDREERTVRWPPSNVSNTGTGNNNNTGGGTRPVATATATTAQTNNPRPPTPVTLSYKGYMTRVDGVPLAQIHESATRTTKFYAANQTAPAKDTTLLAVTHESITLRLPDGTEQTINFGASLEF